MGGLKNRLMEQNWTSCRINQYAAIIEDCGRVYLFLLKTCLSNFKSEISILLGSTGAKIGTLILGGQCDISNPLGCVAKKGTTINGYLEFTGDKFSEQILFQNKYS